MLDESKMRLVRNENVLGLADAEVAMIRWMCGLEQLDKF